MPTLITDLLNLLQKHQLVKHVRVLHYDETPSGKVELKIRCRLLDNYQFQIWLHYELVFQDYAYQLFTDQPILRWDNAPHYPAIATAPHHFHDEHGQVKESVLSGQPLRDLPQVLSTIEIWLTSKKEINA
ncbi:MAG: DUF6516 family protein [Caldilineaceae bacterium]